jgi:hypothetical protein
MSLQNRQLQGPNRDLPKQLHILVRKFKTLPKAARRQVITMMKLRNSVIAREIVSLALATSRSCINDVTALRIALHKMQQATNVYLFCLQILFEAFKLSASFLQEKLSRR